MPRAAPPSPKSDARSFMAAKTPRAALAGIRVIDFTRILAGPYCTRLLADLGAEVIKVEPLEGDHLRRAAPTRDGESAYFGHLNCGKKSLAVDLRREQGQELCRRLAAASDVVVENFRPGVTRRLGIDYERLKPLNRGLIYGSISGYGQVGPGSKRSGYAATLHAASGYDLTNLLYQGRQTKPGKTGIFVADVLTGALAASALQAALLHRERSGEGQYVDVAMMDAMLSLMPYDMQAVQFPAEKDRHVYEPVQAADGFLVVAPVTDANFAALAAAVGQHAWLQDARFSTVRARSRHWSELMVLVERWSSMRSAAECMAALDAAGCPAARYATLAEAMADPQVAFRRSLATATDRAGSYRVAASPYKLSVTPPVTNPNVPQLGEHNRSILRDILGLPEMDIEALEQGGILSRP